MFVEKKQLKKFQLYAAIKLRSPCK